MILDVDTGQLKGPLLLIIIVSQFTIGHQTHIDVGLITAEYAFQAMKRYNNVLFDKKSLKIEILRGNTQDAPFVARVNATVMNGRMKRTNSIECVLLFDLSFFHSQEKRGVCDFIHDTDYWRQ